MRQQRCVMGVMTDPSTGPVASSDLCQCQQYFPAHPRTQCRGWWLIFRTGEVRQHDIVWASVLHFLHQYWQNSVSLLVESFHTYKWAFKHCLSVWNLDTCPLKLWKLWSCLIWRMLVQTPDCAVLSIYSCPLERSWQFVGRLLLCSCISSVCRVAELQCCNISGYHLLWLSGC